MAKKTEFEIIHKKTGCYGCKFADKSQLGKGPACTNSTPLVMKKDGLCTNRQLDAQETKIIERAMIFRRNFETCANPKFQNFVDERCECNCLRSEHNDVGIGEEIPVGFRGHGSCCRCDCEQYRWKSFVKRVKEKRMAFHILETQVNSKGEYNALIAVEGERGYFKTDWYWSTDIKLARECADERNARLGLSKEEAAKIVCSSFKGVKTP
jgi:hypothetical protein